MRPGAGAGAGAGERNRRSREHNRGASNSIFVYVLLASNYRLNVETRTQPTPTPICTTLRRQHTALNQHAGYDAINMGNHELYKAETLISLKDSGQSKSGTPFLPRLCSRTLMDCFVLRSPWKGRDDAIHQRPLDAVACCPLLLLTRALLMTSSRSKASSMGLTSLQQTSCSAQTAPHSQADGTLCWRDSLAAKF